MGNKKSKLVPTPTTDHLEPVNNILFSIDPNSVPDIPGKGERVECRICSIYDGDTCTALFMVGSTPIKTHLRFSGIDAPEIRGSSELEKQAAIAVRDWLKKYLDSQTTWWVYIIGKEKYGRALCDVYDSEVSQHSLNENLLKRGMVKRYTGGKREAWTDEELYEIIELCSP